MHLFRAALLTLVVIDSLGASPAPPITTREAAWGILQSGVKSDNTRRRAAAIRSLGLVPGDSRAAKYVTAALDDPKPEVRTAAATSAGQSHLIADISKLKTMLDDPEMTVTLAAAHALTEMKDHSAYEAYYAVLTGERKGKGVIAAQLATLHDPKKMAILGVNEGIGFVPFASIGWDAIRAMRVDDASPVRAGAAAMLADDPDPKSLAALEKAASDKSWLVRIAALEALAKRKDAGVLEKIELSMYDDRSEVRYTAAALVLHLSRRELKRR